MGVRSWGLRWWVGMYWTYPIQVALPKKSSMKAMMTKMPQPVMLACALGVVLVGERLRAGLHHGEVVLARAEVGLSLSQGLEGSAICRGW